MKMKAKDLKPAFEKAAAKHISDFEELQDGAEFPSSNCYKVMRRLCHIPDIVRPLADYFSNGFIDEVADKVAEKMAGAKPCREISIGKWKITGYAARDAIRILLAISVLALVLVELADKHDVCSKLIHAILR